MWYAFNQIDEAQEMLEFEPIAKLKEEVPSWMLLCILCGSRVPSSYDNMMMLENVCVFITAEASWHINR